jgi:hypothetical protein
VFAAAADWRRFSVCPEWVPGHGGPARPGVHVVDDWLVATVRVTRPSGRLRDVLRAYTIRLDDEKVGSVRSGQSLEVSRTPGPHRLRAALSYLAVGDVGSEPIEIALADDVAESLVQPTGSPVFKPGDVRGRRTSYLELVPASAQ